MQFLSQMKPIDWFVVAIIDLAVFCVGYMAGEDSVAAADEKKEGCSKSNGKVPVDATRS